MWNPEHMKKRGGIGNHRRTIMQNLVKAMVGLAALGFVLAVVGAVTGTGFMGKPKATTVMKMATATVAV